MDDYRSIRDMGESKDLCDKLITIRVMRAYHVNQSKYINATLLTRRNNVFFNFTEVILRISLLSGRIKRNYF